MNATVGQECTRVIYATPIWNSADRASGKVVAVDDKTITCEIYVDIPRTMRFNRETGVNVLGDEFGRLELK